MMQDRNMIKNKIGIIFADDHNLVRSGILSLIEDCPEIFIIGEAENGNDLLDRYFESRPDVVLTDIKMPVLSGIEAAEKIIEKDKNARILFLSVFDSEEFIYKALKAGALGLVNKTISKEELILAIETVFKGQKYFGRNYNEEKLCEIFDKYKEEKATGVRTKKRLNHNELAILRLICEGMQSLEIAEKLCLSKKTIDGYRSSILKKLEVSNTPQLIRFALINKIIE